ncbi:MAG TPA: c-type cytochrome [Bryobacteraceae bacterium]|jgi:mono/diheme cytochrome c family protein|nr:c-type cytochrome [Bryobacteraceae bacterium]
MKRFLALLVIPAAYAATIAADSTRGEGLFQTLHCIQCHSVNGHGGTIAPDLGRLVDRNFTPASLAATMWNHAPTMWAAMRERNVTAGDLTDQGAADLLAYFYAARFFEKPGDAGRGKALFTEKHCAQCHGISTPKLPAAPPVSEWQGINQPIELVNAMWNHATTMKQEFLRQKIAWPHLDSQDLTDMLVYLRNLPGTRNATVHVEIVAGPQGQELFQEKGCSGCHHGKLSLPPLLKGQTLTDIAVDMWNHEPLMAASPPTLDLGQMRQIISYIWAEQFFEDSGSASAGARVFTGKHCAGCHNNPSSGAPSLVGQSFNSAVMISALWHHGPGMLDRMKAQNVPWPRFEDHQMSDLLAFLNTGAQKKP